MKHKEIDFLTNSPRIAIVLVNFNGHIDTIECIESVLKSSFQYFKILVVDNSNNDESMAFLEAWANGNVDQIPTAFPTLVYPLSPKPIAYKRINETDIDTYEGNHNEIVFIRSNRNEGFAAANNIAIKYVLRTDLFSYVWLLNNDTVIENNTLSELVKFTTDVEDKVAIVASKLLKYRDREYLQAVGGRYNRWFGIVSEIGANQRDEGQWDKKAFTFDYVIGASMFVRTAFIRDIGLMEQDLFLYYEELDWAFSGKKRGWTQSFCSSSKVYHKMGSTIKGVKAENTIIADFYSARNRIQIARKHFPLTLITLYPSFIVYVINRIKSKQWKRISLLMKILVNPSLHLKQLK